jgi:hypothetical protein
LRDENGGNYDRESEQEDEEKKDAFQMWFLRFFFIIA